MTPLLSLFTDTEVRELLKRAPTRNFSKGQAIFRKGDPGTGMYVVVSGHVATNLEASRGGDRPLRVYGAG